MQPCNGGGSPPVPREVVVGAITVAFAVGRIVLVVVRHQVEQREAVMCYDEVDALVRPPADRHGESARWDQRCQARIKYRVPCNEQHD